MDRGKTVDAAWDEWRKAKGRDAKYVLETYITGVLGLVWTWVKSIKGFAWCGAFAAYCLGCGGLGYFIRYKRMASTLRLYRHIKPINPAGGRPGDIAVVNNWSKDKHGRIKKEGTHIAVIVAVHDGYFETIEGNAYGVTTKGYGYGVIHITRPLMVKDGGPGLAHICPVTGRKATHEVQYVYSVG